MPSIYDYTVQTANKESLSLENYKNHLMLIVNTASKCGFAPQFEGLENLYKKYKDDDFIVFGFPCGQFQHQEYDDIKKTTEYCQLNYGVTFPMFAKIDVNGPSTEPLFAYLKEEQPGLLNGKIKWNFTKFLIDRQGNVVKRYAPRTTPESIEQDIKDLLY
ncbi:glutathione peroxidase [Lacticigenium naphthae]|uniref:glutathione peroxidase n=1 Tax=Lacticigenium naphthae TaxID=515351 RepID=UPI00041F3A87|nr:glutathione peroxidase [Lacticigenium naphthae]